MVQKSTNAQIYNVLKATRKKYINYSQRLANYKQRESRSPHSRFSSYLIHGLHPDDYVLLAVPVDVSADARLEVLADAVELLGRRDGVVDERLHLVLDEAVLRVGRVDAVDVALEGGAARRATAQALRHGEAGRRLINALEGGNSGRQMS